ncbi:hypothetical protein BJY59DRAFT_320416 [Rhodotorula toruloides]
MRPDLWLCRVVKKAHCSELYRKRSAATALPLASSPIAFRLGRSLGWARRRVKRIKRIPSDSKLSALSIAPQAIPPQAIRCEQSSVVKRSAIPTSLVPQPCDLFAFFAFLSSPSPSTDAPSARYSLNHASSALASSSPISLAVVKPTLPVACWTISGCADCRTRRLCGRVAERGGSGRRRAEVGVRGERGASLRHGGSGRRRRRNEAGSRAGRGGRRRDEALREVGVAGRSGRRRAETGNRAWLAHYLPPRDELLPLDPLAVKLLDRLLRRVGRGDPERTLEIAVRRGKLEVLLDKGSATCVPREVVEDGSRVGRRQTLEDDARVLRTWHLEALALDVQRVVVERAAVKCRRDALKVGFRLDSEEGGQVALAVIADPEVAVRDVRRVDEVLNLGLRSIRGQISKMRARRVGWTDWRRTSADGDARRKRKSRRRRRRTTRRPGCRRSDTKRRTRGLRRWKDWKLRTHIGDRRAGNDGNRRGVEVCERRVVSYVVRDGKAAQAHPCVL